MDIFFIACMLACSNICSYVCMFVYSTVSILLHIPLPTYSNVSKLIYLPIHVSTCSNAYTLSAPIFKYDHTFAYSYVCIRGV